MRSWRCSSSERKGQKASFRRRLASFVAALCFFLDLDPEALSLARSLRSPLSLTHATQSKQTTKHSKQVWKTYLGRNRGTGTLQAVRDIYSAGGASAFWAGTGAKMVESASKGLILMYSKESLLKVLEKAHVSPGELIEWRWERRGREREEEEEEEEGLRRAREEKKGTKKTEMTRKTTNQPFLVETEKVPSLYEGPVVFT